MFILLKAVKSIYKNIKMKFKNREDENTRIVTIYPKNKIIGRALLSYLEYPLLWEKNDKRLGGHSNKWESREIANIFNCMGFKVDAINWMDQDFYLKNKYDIIFDIYTNLQRLAPFLGAKTIKILHLTGSYPLYQNEAELKRVEAFEKRRKLLYSPKRLVKDVELVEKSLKLADVCSLLGNDYTLKTYPNIYRKKINLVTVSTSELSYLKSEKDYVPNNREFMWFLGGGAIHKGLDLLLEVFSKNKNFKLNIVGNIETEKDFFEAYRIELTKFPNIVYHGYVELKSRKFNQIIKNVFCFIAPSCSEAISTAAATCLKLGLFPIISRDTGITLPSNCGIYLENCSINEIEDAIFKVINMKRLDLIEQISTCQRKALRDYSREKFTKDMTEFLSRTLKNS